MARKRMFSLDVVDTDDFLNLSPTAQLLYFWVGMYGDDDGFVASPRKIMKAVGCSASDLDELVKAGFLLSFDSGVIAIRDWKLNNTLKNDRYHETVYKTEKSLLSTDTNGRYFINTEPDWNQTGTVLEPEPNVVQRSSAEPSLAERNQAQRSVVVVQQQSATEPQVTNDDDLLALESYARKYLPNVTDEQVAKMKDFSQLLPVELVKFGIGQACAHDVPSFAYTQRILYSYVERGFKSVADAESNEQRRQQGGGGRVYAEENDFY